MNSIAIFGVFMGDEAKARVTHWMAKDYDYIVRFGGSSNAGHTIYDNGLKIVRHLIPSADFSALNNKAFLGSGMVINVEELLSEVKDTENMFPGAASRIIVDPDAFVIKQHHIIEDREKNVGRIGSTGKGVTPSYRDKINRCGIKIQNLIDQNDETINELKKLGVQFKYVLELKEEFKKSKIIFEGSQSILLDPNFGSYPYVTSGECGLGGIINSGFGFVMPHKVYGICKAYSTRVGEGPFPTEIFGEEAEKLRELGGEYGATTGRPRRIGHLDLPALKYSCIKGGITDLVITKFDVLNNITSVPVATSYDKEPVSGKDFFTSKPNYTNVDGWKDAKDVKQLSKFIELVESNVGISVKFISCGTGKSDLISI